MNMSYPTTKEQYRGVVSVLQGTTYSLAQIAKQTLLTPSRIYFIQFN